jgi:hypothetical protein
MSCVIITVGRIWRWRLTRRATPQKSSLSCTMRVWTRGATWVLLHNYYEQFVTTDFLTKQAGLSSKASSLYSEGEKLQSQPVHWLTWLRFFTVFLKYQDSVLTLWLPSLTTELPARNANAAWCSCTEKLTMLSSDDLQTTVGMFHVTVYSFL